MSDDNDQAAPLDADQHVRAQLPSDATNVIDIDGAWGRSDHDRHIAVSTPTQGRNAAWHLPVGFPGQDGIHHQRFEALIPQTPGFCRPRIDIGRRKSDFPGIEQYRVVEFRRPIAQVFLHHFDGDFNQLQCLLQTHRSQQFSWSSTKDIRGDPGRRVRVVVPADERRDSGLGHHSHRTSPAGGHIPVPRQLFFECRQGRGRQLSGEVAQPLQGLFFRHFRHATSAFSPARGWGVLRRRLRRCHWYRQSRREADTSESRGRPVLRQSRRVPPTAGEHAR